MKDLISVIIPVYKVEAYMGCCLDSVLAQTYTELEIILVDDGSPDECPAICDAYARKDARVKVIHQKNAGLSGARNAGMDIARGSFFAFIDSDDFVAPDFIECLYNACVSTDSEIAICRWDYVHGHEAGDAAAAFGRLAFGENGPEVRPYEPENPKEQNRQNGGADRAGGAAPVISLTGRELMENLYRQPDGAYFVVAWNKLYRRELFDGIRYPLGRIHEDEATTHRIFHRVQRGAFVDRTLYGYFVSPKSITHGFNPRRLDWITGVSGRLDFFEENGYEELMPQALQAFADGMIDIYFGLVDYQPENKTEQRRIRALVREGQRRIKKYGRFPLRTAIGYWLFARVPGIYRKLLDRVKEENGKQ